MSFVGLLALRVRLAEAAQLSPPTPARRPATTSHTSSTSGTTRMDRPLICCRGSFPIVAPRRRLHGIGDCHRTANRPGVFFGAAWCGENAAHMTVSRPQRAVERPVNVRPRRRFDECPAVLFRVLDCFANALVGLRGRVTRQRYDEEPHQSIACQGTFQSLGQSRFQIPLPDCRS